MYIFNIYSLMYSMAHVSHLVSISTQLIHFFPSKRTHYVGNLFSFALWLSRYYDVHNNY